MNKLVQREAFIHSVRVKCVELKDKFLPEGLTAFFVSLVKEETAKLKQGRDRR